jgi:hypothetical protein
MAYGPRHEDPPRPLTHWDFFLKEVHWMARDFGQVRVLEEQRCWRRGLACVSLRVLESVSLRLLETG